jgi:hypothetical protein
MAGSLKRWGAAEIIGISDRSLRRWRERYEEFGYDGLFDGRKKRPSPKTVPVKAVVVRKNACWSVAFTRKIAGHNCVAVVSQKTRSIAVQQPAEDVRPVSYAADSSGISENAELDQQFVRNASLAPTRIPCRYAADADKDVQILR